MPDNQSIFDVLFTWHGVVNLITLSVLEIILGIDNIIFISIAVDKLPRALQKRARFIGLSLALLVRSVLLCLVGWIAHLRDALFTIGDYGVSGKSLILFGGGVFLIYKTWKEIIEKLHEHEGGHTKKHDDKNSFGAIIVQIIIIDFIFSFDSILAAVGVSGEVVIMIGGVVISMILMILFSGYVADFINRNQGIKTIALAFLLVIGGILVGEAMIDAYNFTVPEAEHLHLNKNYAYIALAFAMFIEFLNMREKKIRRRKEATSVEEPQK
ncbi:MAG: TerC family protein [Sphingobacteriaceae bacterium]|nr:TerC family protein [Sphingobacteriaceae bacterium]